MTRSHLIACLVGAGLALNIAGCGTDLSSVGSLTAFTEFMTELCGRFQSCSPTAFNAAYPTGPNQCVNDAVNQVSLTNSTITPCLRGELDTCKADISTIPCSGFSSGSNLVAILPNSCLGC